MKCPDCNPIPSLAPEGDAPDCLRCNGIGEICARCGESADDLGVDLCQNCREDEDFD